MKLEDVIVALHGVRDTSKGFYDLTTHKIEWLDELSMTYNEYEAAAEVLAQHGFERLPEQREINKYHMMEDFANEHDSAELFEAIDGRGAFRRFKSAIRRLGLLEEWYRFREEQYKRLALEWCEECGIELEPE